MKFELDKDLLSCDNKIYSPETCIFLPNKKSNNTSGFTGVSFDKPSRKYRARIYDFHTGKLKYVGIFTLAEDGGNAYRLAREKEAEKAKEWMRNLGLYSEEIVQKIK